MITHEEIAQKRLVAEMSDDFGQRQREVDEVSRLAAELDSLESELGRLEGKMGTDTPVSPIQKRPPCGTHCSTFEEALAAIRFKRQDGPEGPLWGTSPR